MRTQGKWNVYPEYINRRSSSFWIHDSIGKAIALMYSEGGSPKDNAEFIVRAVNAYEPMLAALKQCREYLEHHTLSRTGQFAADVADKAIALAEGKDG